MEIPKRAGWLPGCGGAAGALRGAYASGSF